VRFDDKIHQSGGVSAKRHVTAAFSMLFFWRVLYLGMELRARPLGGVANAPPDLKAASTKPLKELARKDK
jgi:hypothetical protein